MLKEGLDVSTKDIVSNGLVCLSISKRQTDHFLGESGERLSKGSRLLAFISSPPFFFITPIQAEEQTLDVGTRNWVIPILGTTLNDQWEQVGIVAEVGLQFIQRNDHTGLKVRFHTSPGRFSSPGSAFGHRCHRPSGRVGRTEYRFMDHLVYVAVCRGDLIWRKFVGDGCAQCHGFSEERPLT